MVHVPTLYTTAEWKTSPTPNELLRRSSGRNGLNVRLDGPEGCSIGWAVADSTDPTGWGSASLALIERLLPHLRQFVRVRQALAKADALRAPLTHLLDNAMSGVLFLDRHGRIVETNARALRILRRGDGVQDEDGFYGTKSAVPVTPPSTSTTTQATTQKTTSTTTSTTQKSSTPGTSASGSASVPSGR